ncbi:hypothetical protein [Hydrogenobacter thermophilus]|uniref:hypothetical protein n=1 Tax=Hydrogenobacter thermophilus TaxID=940 RepID=UPI0030F4D6AE
MREALKVLFLIVSYNFLLEYVSSRLPLPVRLFPEDIRSFVMLLSFDSALYLAWLFGYRNTTLLWLAYLFFFQILGISFIDSTYTPIAEYTPSFLITLLFLRFSESPTERRTREIKEEIKKLERELERNRGELETLREQVKLSEDLILHLNKEKAMIEEKLNELRDSQMAERQALLKERDQLAEKIRQAEISLSEYKNKLERITEANRKLFELLEILQRREEGSQKGEIAQLRKERKKLVKEVLELRSLWESSEREKAQLKLEVLELKSSLEKLQRERDLLELELQELKSRMLSKEEVYMEVLGFVLDNIEMEERALREFISLPVDKKREFMKELLLLNMKGRDESLEAMKGLKNVFKLKPRGGRIYFTFGQKLRWRVLGLIASEDDKDKDRYAKEILVKYMQ